MLDPKAQVPTLIHYVVVFIFWFFLRLVIDLIELLAEPTYCYVVISMKHEHDKAVRIIVSKQKKKNGQKNYNRTPIIRTPNILVAKAPYSYKYEMVTSTKKMGSCF